MTLSDPFKTGPSSRHPAVKDTCVASVSDGPPFGGGVQGEGAPSPSIRAEQVVELARAGGRSVSAALGDWLDEVANA